MALKQFSNRYCHDDECDLGLSLGLHNHNSNNGIKKGGMFHKLKEQDLLRCLDQRSTSEDLSSASSTIDVDCTLSLMTPSCCAAYFSSLLEMPPNHRFQERPNQNQNQNQLETIPIHEMQPMTTSTALHMHMMTSLKNCCSPISSTGTSQICNYFGGCANAREYQGPVRKGSKGLLMTRGAAQMKKKSSKTPTVIVSRECTKCHTTTTSLWRNGPNGPKTLCNACGMRYKREVRRAAVFLKPKK